MIFRSFSIISILTLFLLTVDHISIFSSHHNQTPTVMKLFTTKVFAQGGTSEGVQLHVKSTLAELHIVTSTKVIGGIPGNSTPTVNVSMSFGLVPVEDSSPNFTKGRVLVSDENGQIVVELPPGKYWLGPKERVEGDVDYRPGNFELKTKIIEVKKEILNEVRLLRIGYAP